MSEKMNRKQLEGFEKPVNLLLGLLAAIIVIGVINNYEVIGSDALDVINYIAGAYHELNGELGEIGYFFQNAGSIDVFSALLQGKIPGENLPEVLTP